MIRTFDWSHFFFGFDGRMGREDFWCGSLALFAALTAVILLTSFLPAMAQDFVAGVAYTASIYPAAALMGKRLQDRGKGLGYLYLFLGLPVVFSIFNLFGPAPSNPITVLLSALYLLVMLWALIELCFLRGTSGENDFGVEPDVAG